MDLLTIRDLEPPMGDFAVRSTLATTRARWAAPIEGEDDAPAHRTIHSRILQLHQPGRLDRVGVRRTSGYHKCGSRMDLDWVSAFRVLIWDGADWREVRRERDVRPPGADEVLWFDVGGVPTSAVVLEARRSGIDAWWPGWNVVSGGFVLDGAVGGPLAPRKERHLATALPGDPETRDGVEVRHEDGAVRFRSRFLEVGFSLSRTGFTYLALDDEGNGRTSYNLIRRQPGSWFQGLFLSPVGGAPVAAMSLRNDVAGRVEVRGTRVRYEVEPAGTGQSFVLTWDVHERGMELAVERRGKAHLRAHRSAAWCLGLDSRVSPSHVIGRITRNGETGLVYGPAWLHVPGKGSLRLAAEGDVLWRSDAFRDFDLSILELKVGEEACEAGDYLLRDGEHIARLTLTVDRLEPDLRPETPSVVRRAIERTVLTSMTYRPDTGTLSNNGISMHCPISMDNWSAVALRIGALLPGLDAADLLSDSLERWLDGGPGYTSGPLLQDGRYYETEDEYVMTAAAGLLGLAEFLTNRGDPTWLARFGPAIRRRLDRTRSYDVDGDGLIESTYRTGTSGSGQWSTCWLDVVSFGWKDAFTNALLYRALRLLHEDFLRLGAPDLADGLDTWAAALRAHYRPTFFNAETGWIAGWRCRNDALHDHAFPMVTGAAVVGGVIDPDDGREMLKRLLAEMEAQGVPHARFGLPVSFRAIPDEDLADIMQGYPKGYYQNAGLTHAQTRHFVSALYHVGLIADADRLLDELSEGMAEMMVFGGSKSGVDWRAWDGSPCGYEGLLTDQFGILAVALERYRR